MVSADVYKYFSGARLVYISTSPAPEKYQISKSIEILLRRRKSVFKYFSGAGEAWEVFKNTFSPPEKYLYTLFRRRRSAYIHLSDAGEVGEAGEAEEKHLYTPVSAVEKVWMV